MVQTKVTALEWFKVSGRQDCVCVGMAESKMPEEWKFLFDLTLKELDNILFGRCDCDDDASKFRL